MELCVNKNPCSSCPYRKDVPLGIWEAVEYEKLRAYDNNGSFAAFLCHHSTNGKETVCKGWLVVHVESVAVRLLVIKGAIPDESRYDIPTVPLYGSGNEAADAGEAGIKKPSGAAKEVMKKISKKRKNLVKLINGKIG